MVSKLRIFDIILNPIKKWAGVETYKHEKMAIKLRRDELSSERRKLDHQELAFSLEQIKITSAILSTGYYDVHDIEFAKQPLLVEEVNEYNEVIIKEGYNYEEYIKQIELKKGLMKSLEKNDYIRLTSIQQVINDLESKQNELIKVESEVVEKEMYYKRK